MLQITEKENVNNWLTQNINLRKSVPQIEIASKYIFLSTYAEILGNNFLMNI